VSADEVLKRGAESDSDVTRRLAAKAQGLLAQLGARLEAEDKRAAVGRLRRELADARARVRRPQKPMTTAVQAECVRLYVEERLTLAQVGDRVDRPPSSVRRALVSAGVRMRSQRWST
jgi:HEAT repeat protein